MKMYTVRKGTSAILVTDTANGSVSQQIWTVRQDLTFSDTVIDPIRVANNPAEMEGTVERTLADSGYAVFVDFDKPQYRLAVRYKDVGVM